MSRPAVPKANSIAVRSTEVFRMSLGPEQLAYPLRRYGMDHDRYDWSMLPRRRPVQWPDGARVALWVVPTLEWFPLNMQGVPFKPPGAMQTAYPDLRHYTLRDYGNRVGVWRLMELFDRLGLRCTVSLSMAVLDMYPDIAEAMLTRRYELMSHGLYNTRYHWNITEDEERTAIQQCQEIHQRHVRIW